MKIKVCHIRLSKENLISDQETINDFMDNVLVKKTATELVVGQPNYWSILIFYEEYNSEKQEKISNKIALTSETELTQGERNIYDSLKLWRFDKAAELNIPAFMVCHNSELMTIAKVKPGSLEELSKIKGFGGQKISKFGDDIIALLNSVS